MGRRIITGALTAVLLLSGQEMGLNSFEREISPARIERKIENPENSESKNQRTAEKRGRLEEITEKERILERNYELTRDYVSNSMKLYVNNVSKESAEFRSNIKKYGLDEVLRAYTESQICCLKLAREILNHGRDIPSEKECEVTGKYIRGLQKKFSGSYIDYDSGKVIGSHEKYARALTGHFARLLKAGKNCDVSKLVREVYSKEEYLEYGEKQKEANRELYESVRGSARWFVSLLFKHRLNEEIDSLIRNSGERYETSVRDFYGN